MSMITTLCRYVCEQKSGLNESVGFSKIDDVIENSYNKIFTTSAIIGNADYTKEIQKKILKHYYMNEIGQETVGLWQYCLNMTFEEIASYYTKLYEIFVAEINPLINYKTHETSLTKNDKNETTDFTGNQTQNNNNNETGNSTTNVNGNNTSKTNTNVVDKNIDRYSDTPHNSIASIENNTYLTNVRIDDKTSNNTTNNTTENHQTTINNNTRHTTNLSSNTTKNKNEIESNSNIDFEKTVESLTTAPQELLQKYKEFVFNLDRMIIDEFKECFLYVFE